MGGWKYTLEEDWWFLIYFLDMLMVMVGPWSCYDIENKTYVGSMLIYGFGEKKKMKEKLEEPRPKFLNL